MFPMASLWTRLHLGFWTLLILTLGYSLGTFGLKVEEVGAPPAPITVSQEDTHEGIPLVRVQEINDGEIVGNVGEGARLIIGDEVITPRDDGSFRADARAFLVNIIDVKIPHGVLFVASSRGKNYYPVDSSAGEKLAPANRIYFRSAEEAEAMGYKKGY